jgi:hypothetical protein
MAVTIPIAGVEIAGGVVDEGITFDEFGFVVMDRVGGSWLISLRNVRGEEILACELEGNVMTCFE